MCGGRTLLSAAFDFDFTWVTLWRPANRNHKPNNNIKGGGQECPSHTE